MPRRQIFSGSEMLEKKAEMSMCLKGKGKVAPLQARL
jgi:hypothetical protein